MEATRRSTRLLDRRARAPAPVPIFNADDSLVLNHTSQGRLFWRRPANYVADPNAILDDAVYSVTEKLQFPFTQHRNGLNIYVAEVYRENHDRMVINRGGPGEDVVENYDFDIEGGHFARSLHALCLSVLARLRRLNTQAPISSFQNDSVLFDKANVRFLYEVNYAADVDNVFIRNWSSTQNPDVADKVIRNQDLFPISNNNLVNIECPSWIQKFQEAFLGGGAGSGGINANFNIQGYQFTGLINNNPDVRSLSMYRHAISRSPTPQRDLIVQFNGTRYTNSRAEGFDSFTILYKTRFGPRRIAVPAVEALVGDRPPYMFANRGRVAQEAPPRNLRQYFPEGGCRDTINQLLDQSTLSVHEKTNRQVKGNSPGFVMDLNNMVVWCPNVKNNNCFFACIKYFILQESKNKKESYYPFIVSDRVDVWRTQLNIPAKKMINFENIYNFIQSHLFRNVRIYDEHHNHVTTMRYEGATQQSFYHKGEPDKLPYIDLVLFHEHFFVITRHTLALYSCAHCGKRNIVNMDKHVCNENTVSYYNKRVVHSIVYEDKRPKQNENVTNRPCMWENLLFYDFETFFNGSKHQVYAVGAVLISPDGTQHYFSFTGDTAMETFMMYLREMRDMGTALTMVSYNGSNFDHYFILEELIKTGETMEEFVMNKGRLLQIKFMGHKLLDIWNFLGPASLDANCKSYQIPVAKHVFPHLFIREWKHLDYVGPMLDQQYYPAHMRAKYGEWRSQQSPDYVFNLMSECEYYLRLDVECLVQLSLKFMGEMWSNFNIFLPNFLTLSQTAFSLWRASLNPNWQIPLPIDPILYAVTNEATYGGRCHFVKRHFNSVSYIEGFTDYSEITDYLIDLDVVSLYPASMMSIEYPCGEVTRVESRTDVAVLQEWLTSHGELPIGIYEVQVECPTHYLVPPLPRKNTKGHTVWNNLSSERQVYTNIDIRTGLRYGYRFNIISAFVWKERQPLFGQYIHDMFQNKAKQDIFKQSKDPQYNPAAREVFKKLMNALYGKMMQKRQFEDHEFVDNDLDEDDAVQNKKWTKFLDEHSGVQYKELTESVMMMSGSRHNFEKTVTKPHYLGAFILAHSRRIMNDMYDVVDPTRLMAPTNYSWKDSMHNSFFYTDTDSLIVHASQMAQCAHKMGKDLGTLADELDGGKIIEGYFLSPKLYCVKYMTPDNKVHEKIRAKGIPNSLLEFQDYKNMYLNNDPSRYDFVQMRRIQQDVNVPQQSKGMEPFTIISVLDAHRTLNAKGTYGTGGELGGRVVLDSVWESVPLGFEANEPVRYAQEEEMVQQQVEQAQEFDWDAMESSMIGDDDLGMIYI